MALEMAFHGHHLAVLQHHGLAIVDSPIHDSLGEQRTPTPTLRHLVIEVFLDHLETAGGHVLGVVHDRTIFVRFETDRQDFVEDHVPRLAVPRGNDDHHALNARLVLVLERDLLDQVGQDKMVGKLNEAVLASDVTATDIHHEAQRVNVTPCFALSTLGVQRRVVLLAAQFPYRQNLG